MELLGVMAVTFVLSFATNVVVKKFRMREHLSVSVQDAAIESLKTNGTIIKL